MERVCRKNEGSEDGMQIPLLPALSHAAKWSNANQGVLSLGIFATTLLLGWVSGIFGSLRRKPRFKLKLIPGPTFSCTFETGGEHAGFPVHRTALALYLNISNVGSASSSIHAISVGYHWRLRPFSRQWLQYGIGWFWLHEQVVALEEFQTKIGESIKFYPFLTQISAFAPSETYLEVGKSTNGVVYFEQEDSWGGCFPRVEKGTVKIRVSVRDVFNHRHQSTFQIPFVSLDEARKFNPSFGKTRAELQKQTLPFDGVLKT
jgi:hypothetical protein